MTKVRGFSWRFGEFTIFV